MIKKILAVLSLAYVTITYADDGSAVVVEPIQVQEMNKQVCIDRYASYCMSTVCITSEARDCSEQCRAAAREKCKNHTH